MTKSREQISRELTVSGDVQGVGYRRLVRRIALEFKMNGYLENRLDGTVKIVAQGSEENIEGFLAASKIAPLRLK